MQSFDSRMQSETIEQLWAQVAFLGIARTDQDEARRVAHAQPLAFDDIAATRSDIK